jgi:hypothetical protein
MRRREEEKIEMWGMKYRVRGKKNVLNCSNGMSDAIGSEISIIRTSYFVLCIPQTYRFAFPVSLYAKAPGP